ncbi:MAG: AgmX/PglI C-terminal domain-containing protein, partial [Polyangiaceae bacterium]|nr:AgmX/PglI C-terminal domain-containing protein [Polyangiaceae bacterium]
VPSAIQITVRWGASILMAKRISPPKTMLLTGGVGKLELGTQGLELVAGGERHRVVRGKRIKVVVDDVEIVIDATEDKLALIPLAPAMDHRHAAADVGSFLLHGGALAFCFFWRAPLSHAETELPELRQQMIQVEETRRIELQQEELPNALPSASIDVPAASPAAPARERRGTLRVGAFEPTYGVSHDALLQEAATFGMIGLLAQSDGGTDPVWNDFQLASSVPGMGGEVAEMFGGDREDALSTFGSGAGGVGQGIGLGSMFDPCVDIRCPRLRPQRKGSPELLSIGYAHNPKVPNVRMRYSSDGVSGRIPPEAIQRIVRQSFGRFRGCYQDAVGVRGGESARVTVRFVIGRDGSVTSASAASDAPETNLASCVTKAFYSLSFPQPDGDAVVSVTYPLVFTPDE